jgi:hypothetical protein
MRRFWIATVFAALLLTSPFTPMLWMGEEWAASTPWPFFTSHPEPDLAEATATQPGAFERQYIPSSGKILVASRLLQPRESQKLAFTALKGTVPNRGGLTGFGVTTGQPDIDISALSYLQLIDDALSMHRSEPGSLQHLANPPTGHAVNSHSATGPLRGAPGFVV